MNLKSIFSFLFASELQELESCKDEIEELKKINQDLEYKLSEEKKIVEVEVPIVPKNFDSYHDMRQWLFTNPISEREYNTKTFNCADFATTTQLAALKDGYIINVELDIYGEYNDTNEKHMVCNCIIPNENMVYVIEPQDDSIVYRSIIKGD